MLAVFLTATEEEIRSFINLEKSGEPIHVIIDPVGKVTIEGGKGAKG